MWFLIFFHLLPCHIFYSLSCSCSSATKDSNPLPEHGRWRCRWQSTAEGDFQLEKPLGITFLFCFVIFFSVFFNYYFRSSFIFLDSLCCFRFCFIFFSYFKLNRRESVNCSHKKST